MKLLNGRDVLSALVTGFTTGFIAWRVLIYLDTALPLGIDPILLVYVMPVLWMAGVQLGYALATVARPFAQFGKFAAIGFANAAVDFGVLYLLIAATGITGGLAYVFFKTVSFIVAIVHSYLWNKYWAFDAGRETTTGRELFSFAVVSIVSLVINVAAASVTVAAGPLGGLDTKSWAGIGAIIGSAVALIFSFVGFRIFVFRKK